MSRTLDSSQRFHSLPSTMLLLLFIDSTLFYQRAPLAVQNQRFSLSSAPRLPESGRHPHPTSPTAPACRHRSAAGATAMMHIDPEDRLLPPVSPLVGVSGERVFFWSLTKDHQGAPSAGWGVWSHGDHGCILNGAMWKAESIFRLNLITLIVLK